MFNESGVEPSAMGKVMDAGAPLTKSPDVWYAFRNCTFAPATGSVPVGHPIVGEHPWMSSGRTGHTVVRSQVGVPGYVAPERLTPVRPVALVEAPESSKPTTSKSCVQVPAWIAALVEALAVGFTVVMMGMMFAPQELSRPPSPSTCACLDAPATRVQTSVDAAVVTLPSRSQPYAFHADGSVTPVRVVSPRYSFESA